MSVRMSLVPSVKTAVVTLGLYVLLLLFLPDFALLLWVQTLVVLFVNLPRLPEQLG